MRILLLAHTFAGGAFVVGSHHYARELAALGHEVVHLSTPLSAIHRLTGRAPAEKVRAAAEGTAVVEGARHIVPATLAPVGFGGGRSIRRILADFEPDVVLLDQPQMMSRSLSRSAAALVYRPTDTYASGVPAARQRQAVRAADALVCTSAEVLRQLPQHTAPSTVIRNGVDYLRFSGSDLAATRSGVVYVGALDHRFDWAAVSTWAESLSHASFDLYGPVSGPTPPLPHNVNVRGAIPYEQTPAVMASAAIGIIPLSAASENAGRSPMKLFEYAASGLWVAASRTPSLAAGHPRGTWLYDDPSEVLPAMADALAAGRANAEGAADAERESWASKASELLHFLGDSIPDLADKIEPKATN